MKVQRNDVICAYVGYLEGPGYMRKCKWYYTTSSYI